jgi:hypothetical protein
LNRLIQAYWHRPRRFLRDEAGSLLIESSLIMPLMFLFTLVMLALGYLAYQKAALVQDAYEWSERTAYVWKDSHRDPVTGAFTYKELDDVYSSMISEKLGWLGASMSSFRQAGIELPDRTLTGQSLPGTKLLRSSEGLGSAIHGQGSYYNRVLEGEVRAEWNTSWAAIAKMYTSRQDQKLNAMASAFYSDPVELLRTVDIVRIYTNKLKERFSSPSDAAEELKQLLPGKPQAENINSEAKAKAYLRQLIGGSGREAETSYGRRVIDVLDTDGFAHEAKYTVNKSDVKLQIQKDAELIRTGKVKGVVWHFFALKSNGKFDTTPAMLKELEANGIMVVYHR